MASPITPVSAYSKDEEDAAIMTATAVRVSPLRPVTPLRRLTGGGTALHNEDVDVSPISKTETFIHVVKKDSDPNLASSTTTAPGLKHAGDHIGAPLGPQLTTVLGRDGSWKLWISEFVFVVVSILSLMVIVGVLRAYDQKALPDLPLHITLNTFLAFFTTLTKAAFMIPVAESLSQWKWNWYSRRDDRSLADFQTFDEASRGVWGSLSLLGRLRWRHLAILGALVSVIGIVTSPVTQQMIAYPERPVAIPGNASVAAVRHYKSRIGILGQSGLDLRYDIDKGLLQPVRDPILDMAPSCSSGRCTFEPFSSLGVCAKVANVTGLIRMTAVNNATNSDWTVWDDNIAQNPLSNTLAWRVSFPAPANNSFVTPAVMTMYSGQLYSSLSFAGDADLMATKMANMLVAYCQTPVVGTYNFINNATNPLGCQAVEILLHACVRTFRVDVTEGRAESAVDESHAVVGIDSPITYDCSSIDIHSPTQAYVECWGAWDMPLGTLTLRAPSVGVAGVDAANASSQAGGLFTADIPSLVITGEVLTTKMSGSFAWSLNQVMETGGLLIGSFADTLFGVTSDVASDDLKKVFHDKDEQFRRITVHADSIASSISNGIRKLNAFNGTENAYTITGTVWGKETYVSVRWGWMGFLLAQLVLAFVFLVYTVVATEKLQVKVLKGSALAMLFALGPESRAAVGDIEQHDAMKQRAKSMRVKLRSNTMVISERRGDEEAGTEKRTNGTKGVDG